MWKEKKKWDLRNVWTRLIQGKGGYKIGPPKYKLCVTNSINRRALKPPARPFCQSGCTQRKAGPSLRSSVCRRHCLLIGKNGHSKGAEQKVQEQDQEAGQADWEGAWQPAPVCLSGFPQTPLRIWTPSGSQLSESTHSDQRTQPEGCRRRAALHHPHCRFLTWTHGWPTSWR